MVMMVMMVMTAVVVKVVGRDDASPNYLRIQLIVFST